MKWSERQGGYYFCARPSGCGETYYLREIRRRWRIQGGVLAGPSYREGRIVALAGGVREPLRGGQPPPEETEKLLRFGRAFREDITMERAPSPAPPPESSTPAEPPDPRALVREVAAQIGRRGGAP